MIREIISGRASPAASTALPKRMKTLYRCIACDVYLCVGTRSKNFFALYHSLDEYCRPPDYVHITFGCCVRINTTIWLDDHTNQQ